MDTEAVGYLEDARRTIGRLWDRSWLDRNWPWKGEVLAQRAGAPTPDALLYRGFLEEGPSFLTNVRGRFACAHYDHEANRLFFARDWIGETPFHYLATPRGFIVANTISDLRARAGRWYNYHYVRAFPHSRCQVVDLTGADPMCIAETCRYGQDTTYYDFAAAVSARHQDPTAARLNLPSFAHALREDLGRSTELRLAGITERAALLLSGGLDSFTVGLLLRSLDVSCVAYTLAVDESSYDVQQAKQFAKLLGFEHRLVPATDEQIVAAAAGILPICECYHIYNVYCAVGIRILGQALADDGVTSAFCGEGVNEALGDYKDWVVRDPRAGAARVLQQVPVGRTQQTSERVLYVWGQGRDRGKYNRQLGTGLAKHAGSRMYKPLLRHGVFLEAPYYSRRVMARLTALSGEFLQSIGDKPGLFARVFKDDMEAARVPEQLVRSSKKVRLQDGSENGRGGITPVLLEAGFGQRRLLEMFNEEFQAALHVDLESERLVGGRTERRAE